jgi:AAA15 family ATPase/GTPase
MNATNEKEIMAMTSYTTLEVENFKGIRKMKLEGLGMVNVFVGGNNVGKTSVLEAMIIAHNIHNVMHLDYSYDSPTTEDFQEAYKYSEFVERIFGNFRDCDEENISDFDYRYKTYSSANFLISTNENIIKSKSSSASNGTIIIEKKSEDADVITPCGQFCIVSDERHKYRQNSTNLSDSEIVYIGTAPSFYKSIVKYKFSEILEQGNEKEVIQRLQLIQPNLQDILYVQNNKLVCGLDDKKGKRIPLNQMGEGFIKLFALACALPLIKEKSHILLIDEIENGFHYSVQEDMWRMILTAAKDDGTQFFFTTHSYEVLESLNAMTQKIIAEWEEEKAEGYQDGKLLVGENKTSMEPVCVFELEKRRLLTK